MTGTRSDVRILARERASTPYRMSGGRFAADGQTDIASSATTGIVGIRYPQLAALGKLSARD